MFAAKVLTLGLAASTEANERGPRIVRGRRIGNLDPTPLLWHGARFNSDLKTTALKMNVDTTCND